MASLSAHGLVSANKVIIALEFYVCQYIPGYFLFNLFLEFCGAILSYIPGSGKKFFPGVFCTGERSGKDTDTSVVSEIIAVKDNVCSIRIFKPFFRLKSITQDIAVYHTVPKVSQEF